MTIRLVGNYRQCPEPLLCEGIGRCRACSSVNAAVSRSPPGTELAVKFHNILKLINPEKALNILYDPFHLAFLVCSSGSAGAHLKAVMPGEIEYLSVINNLRLPADNYALHVVIEVGSGYAANFTKGRKVPVKEKLH